MAEKKREIRKIAIAGAGTMGYSMADIFAGKGYTVTLYNHREATLEKAKTKISPESAGRIAYTTDESDFAGQDLIVENIAENMNVKLEFYRRLSGVIDDETIVATNTSGLSVNALAAAVKKPERFLGMHWFNPPTLIPLIEIIRNDATRDEAAEAVYELSLAIGKKPAIVNRDVPGFAANRIQFAVLREVCSLVAKGVISKEGADAVMKYGLGFRWACLGPLETADFGGLDTFYHISEYLMPDLEDSHKVPEILAEAYEAGRYGVKNGKGFYDYPGEEAAKAAGRRDGKLKKVFRALYADE